MGQQLVDLDFGGVSRIRGLLAPVGVDEMLRGADIGTDPGTVMAGDDARLSGNEKVANKDVANGYAGLDAVDGGLLDSAWPLVELYLLMGRFGSGKDGPITISLPMQLTRDMHWTDVTFSGSGSIATQGYKIFANGTVSGTTTAPVLIKVSNVNPGLAGAGGNGTASGGQGAAGGAVATGTIGGSGAAGALGGAGTATVGGTPAAGISAPAAHGGNGNTGGAGGAGTGGAGGTNGAISAAAFNPDTAGGGFTVESPDDTWLRGATVMTGGGGGRGGTGAGGNGANVGAGGGGGGAGAAVIDAAFFHLDLASFPSLMTVMSVKGGNGGNGGNATAAIVGVGGGGGGGAGGGGCIRLVVGSITGSNVDALIADGGDGGNGGNANSSAGGGGGGNGGRAGRVTLFHIGATGDVGVSGPRTAPANGALAVGVVGGLGSVGGTCRLSLP